MQRRATFFVRIFVLSYGALLLIDAILIPPRQAFFRTTNYMVVPPVVLSEVPRRSLWPVSPVRWLVPAAALVPGVVLEGRLWREQILFGNGPMGHYWESGDRVSVPWMLARIASTLIAMLLILMICKRVEKHAPTPRGFEILPS